MEFDDLKPLENDPFEFVGQVIVLLGAFVDAGCTRNCLFTDGWYLLETVCRCDLLDRKDRSLGVNATLDDVLPISEQFNLV